MLTQYSKDMERVIRALNLCRNLHEGQVDKCGQPYWIHPFTVAMRSFTGYNRNENQTSTMIVGLLHDIPEDTGIAVGVLTTLIDLTDKEQEALELLTRKNGTSYNFNKSCIMRSLSSGLIWGLSLILSRMSCISLDVRISLVLGI